MNSDEDLSRLHVSMDEQMWRVYNLKLVFRYMNLLNHHTIMPKGGDEAVTASTSQTLLCFLSEDLSSSNFSVFDVTWREIKET